MAPIQCLHCRCWVSSLKRIVVESLVKCSGMGVGVTFTDLLLEQEGTMERLTSTLHEPPRMVTMTSTSRLRGQRPLAGFKTYRWPDWGCML